MSDDLACVICGSPAADLHHLTGRCADGSYLHPRLTAPLCHDDHELCGEDLRDEDLERPCADTSEIGQLAYGIARVATFLARAVEADPGKAWLEPIAEMFRECEETVYAHIRALDDHDPDWRFTDGT